MYICICKSVTDGQIRKAVRDKGINSVRALREELGACDQCGKCAVEARQLIRECQHQQAMAESHSLMAGSLAMASA